MAGIKYKIVLVAVVTALIFASGCITLPRIASPSRPNTVYNWNEEVVTTPKAVIADGKVVVIEEQRKTLNASVVIPKLTFMQRLGNWISGLGIFGIIILIVCLVLFPGATLAFLVKQVFKWKSALIETAGAIKDAKAAEGDNTLEAALKNRQSLETKKLLGKIRPTL